MDKPLHGYAIRRQLQFAGVRIKPSDDLVSNSSRCFLEVKTCTRAVTTYFGPQILILKQELPVCAEPKRSAVRYGTRGEQLYCIQDATIACNYAQLAATALGLATVWIGTVLEPETIREALKITDDLWPEVFAAPGGLHGARIFFPGNPVVRDRGFLGSGFGVSGAPASTVREGDERTPSPDRLAFH